MRCFGCGGGAGPTCPTCLNLALDPFTRQLPSGLACLCATRYEGATRSLVLAAKHAAGWDYSSFLRAVAWALAEQLWVPGDGGLVVPAPSGISRRLSGRYVALDAADELAWALSAVAARMGQRQRWEVVSALAMPVFERAQRG